MALGLRGGLVKPPATHSAPQSGAVTLLVAITMGLLASLASFYSSRSVLIDRLASRNQHQATQARWAAEAALAWARAELLRQSQGPVADWGAEALSVPCPAVHPGLRWQCRLMRPPAHPGMAQVSTQVLAARDLLTSPHVVHLYASAHMEGGNSHAKLAAQLYWPSMAPAQPQPSAAAVVINGCAKPAAGASVRVCPRNGGHSACSGTPVADAVQTWSMQREAGDGPMSGDESSPCLALGPEHLPAGGGLSLPTFGSNNTVCTPHAWRSVLGEIRPEQIRAWSEAQARNGLHALSQPARTIYWVDQTHTWTESLGSEDSPVLLVFSPQACAQRCPDLAPGVRIVGTVVLQTQCQDHKARAWRSGSIEGQLVVESGLPEWQSGSHIAGRDWGQAPYRLYWPAGIDATQVQRVPGSWQEGGP